MRVRDMLLIGALMMLCIAGFDALIRVFAADHGEWINQVMFAAGLIAAGYVVTWLVTEVVERKKK